MSQIYANAGDFEALFTQMFERIESDDPDAMDALVEQDMVVRFRLRSPDVELWVDGRSKPVKASFGDQNLDASFTANMSTNDMHDLLLGKLGLAKALLFRKVKVQGSQSKAMKLEDLLHAMQAVYPTMAPKH